MSTTARGRLAERLGAVGAPVTPCVQLTMNARDLRLEVEGVGPVGFPVPARQARELLALGSPARFGRGEQTLTDPEVRDTWEVPRHLVRLEWGEALTDVLDSVRERFGLPPSCELVADFHSLLVYEPGQFFRTHQDSEKHDSMIGTLVVTLPSVHTGGELIIHHGGESRTHRGWKRDLALVAFHSDRHHEVRPVKTGHRVAVTYNLLLKGAAAPPSIDDESDVEELARCVAEHFATPVPPRFRGDEAGDAPSRLLYLLDHEYTERGLSWTRLKGADIQRASRLRAAAQRSGCEAVLALTEIQETWDAHEPDHRYRRRYRYSGDERGARAAEDEEYELQGLIDSSVTLTYLVDPDGTSQDVSLYARESEVCATTPSAELQPYSSEYEGYMGNYGNTLDRWYRRAAVVVWSRDRSFAARAEAAPAWAVDRLLAQAGGGDAEGARAAAATLAPFWDTVTLPDGDFGEVFETTLRAACALEDPDTARLLVRRFLIEELRVRHMAPLAALAGRYGVEWTGGLLREWFDRREGWTRTAKRSRMGWVTTLPELCQALPGGTGGTGGDGGEAATAHLLVERSWDSLGRNLRDALASSAPTSRTERLAKLGRSLAAVLAAAAATGAADVRGEAVEFCRGRGDELTACLVSALRAAADLPPAAREGAGFEDLAAQCARSLRARLAAPARADGDWSLAPPGGCGCDLCQTLGEFLRDPNRRTFEWPLAKQRRQHVHSRIDAGELPVTHHTRRSGSPYTLVLTKTPQIFERDREARHQDQLDLDQLTEWNV